MGISMSGARRGETGAEEGREDEGEDVDVEEDEIDEGSSWFCE